MNNYKGVQNVCVCAVKSSFLYLSLRATPSPIIFLFAISPSPLYALVFYNSIGKSSAKQWLQGHISPQGSSHDKDGSA